MKKIELKCQNCGAEMEISEDRLEATCQYCKNKVYFEKEEDIEYLAKKEETLNYAAESGRMKAQEESRTRNRNKKVISIVVIILSIFVLFIISRCSTAMLTPMDDPFKCIDVTFKGKSGEGFIEITDNKTCKEFNEIRYNPSKSSNLKENETIKITAESSNYRFEIKDKEYIVTGLSSYLKNLDDIKDEELSELHKLSENIINKGINNIKDNIESVEQYKMYLLTNNANKNYLYDVYKVVTKAKNGKTFEKIMVVCYKNFALTGDSELFLYTSDNLVGNIIKAGNPSELNAMNVEYLGNITGFETEADFESYLKKENDGTFEKKVK